MFEYAPPAGLADTAATPQQAEPAAGDQPAAVAQERRSWVEWLEDRADMRGLGSAQLPSPSVVHAYHKAGNYVPGEAGVIEWPARAHGWVAVLWCTAFTCVAWTGSGAYRQRFHSLWRQGVPGLMRAQLPPLEILSPLPRFWVAWWSAVAWCGLKFWRFPLVLAYLAATVLPIIF